MIEQRKQKIVNAFQWKLARRMVAYWFVYQVTLFNFLFCWRLLSEGAGDLLEQYGRFFFDYWPMFICFLIVVPALAWDAMKFCHRIVGPIVRFRQVTQDVAEGKPVRRVKLRRGDELMELQDDFNAMLDKLAADHSIDLIQNESEATENESCDRAVLAGAE